MQRGDHLKVSRGVYAHHGIYVGEGQIIHYSGEVFQKSDAFIRRDTLDRFAAGGEVMVVLYAMSLPPDVVLRNAESRLGENGYALFENNCEHFAVWCKTGKTVSDQVQDAKAGTASVGGSAMATAGAIAAVSVTGSVAGLSGAGVMSGLAAVGGTVGAGAVGGVVILGLAPAAAVTYGAQVALKDDERFTDEERSARRAGRNATVAGAGIGSIGTVAAIWAAGVPGLSAAGITSGLAALGGGSLVAGTALTIAAPAVAALGVGFGAYRLWKWLAEDRATVDSPVSAVGGEGRPRALDIDQLLVVLRPLHLSRSQTNRITRMCLALARCHSFDGPEHGSALPYVLRVGYGKILREIQATRPAGAFNWRGIKPASLHRLPPTQGRGRTALALQRRAPR